MGSAAVFHYLLYWTLSKDGFKAQGAMTGAPATWPTQVLAGRNGMRLKWMYGFLVAEFRGFSYGAMKRQIDVHPQPFCNHNQKLLSIVLPEKKDWMNISLCLLNNKEPRIECYPLIKEPF